MPITSSAKKALRQSDKRKVRNVRQKDALKALIKNFRKEVLKGKKSEAAKLYLGVQQALDKAAKHEKIVKKNTASRLKSRLALALAKMK